MKKNNLKLSLILLITVLTTLVRSQSPIMSYIADINAHMSSIPLVFEGRVQSVEIFAGDKNGNPLPNSALQWNGDIGYWKLPNGNQGYGYTKAKIKVCKIYKGDIELDENHCFTVLTRAHSMNNIYRDKSDATNIYTSYLYMPATHLGPHEEEVILPHPTYPTKLYLCDKLDPIGATNYAADEYYVSNFHVMYDAPMFVPVEVMGANGMSTMQTAYCQLFAQNVFKDQTEFQTFLAAIGLNPTPTNYCDWDTEHGKPAKQVDETPKRDYAENLKNYAEAMKAIDFTTKRNAAEKLGKKTSSTVDFFADIVNERLTNISGQTWFEFDIKFRQNSAGKYFNNFLLRLSYNPAAFGGSVATNNNIFVTAATPYQIPTYGNPNTVVNDLTNDVVNIPLIPTTNTTTTLSRVLAPTSSQIILTVRLKVAACNLPAALTFTDDIITSFISQYCLTSNATTTSSSVQSYDSGTYTGNITDNTCSPIITSWVNGVPGGINRNCSITGKYFGDTKGTVIFKNADQGTVYPLQQGTNWGGLQKYDITTWTDNQIVFRMPNIIDSAYTMVNGNPFMHRIVPGSGKFQVKNFTGQLKESNAPIDIPYSIINTIDPPPAVYKKFTIHLSSSSGNGYKIQNDPAVTALDVDEKAVFRRAMNDWRCVTEINWSLGQDTTLPGGYSETDNINQVVLSNTLLPVIARTRPQSFVCPPVAGVKKAYLKCFDMQISPTLQNPQQWQFDTIGTLVSTYVDFYAVAAHELGHAHLVDHINDSTNNIMWFASYAYGFPFPNRFKVWYSFTAEDAGNFVTDSLVGGLACAPNHITVPCQNCTGFPGIVGIKNQRLQLDKITVFPNPSSVNQDINIKFDLDKPENVSFRLYTITGSLIKYTTADQTMKENVVLPTDVLTPGMYMLQIDIGGKKQTFKLIKQ